jgi:hypothetical protein
MTFAFIGIIVFGLQKLGSLDAAIFTAHKNQIDGDIFIYVALPVLGLLAVLLSFLLSRFFRWLTFGATIRMRRERQSG